MPCKNPLDSETVRTKYHSRMLYHWSHINSRKQALICDLARESTAVEEIAEITGVNVKVVTFGLRRHNLPVIYRRERDHDLKMREWQPGDPTPEEIEERAAEIRKGWSRHEYARRRVGEAPAIYRSVYCLTGCNAKTLHVTTGGL
jgi:hypothetical protein